jgi:hypothetical protein
MTEQTIYLTTKRLLYNLSKVDLRYGRVTEEYVELRRQIWEEEFNLPDYEKIFGPKKYD